MKKNICVTILTICLAVCLGLCMDIAEEKVKNMPVNSVPTQYDTIDNKSSGWGFKKIKNSEPDIPKSTEDELIENGAYYIDPERPKVMYLTFDEGYENGYTAKILDVLREKQVPAAFFITGPYAKKETELVKRMIDEGHIVGNHTQNHPNMPKLATYDAISSELLELNKTVKELYNYDMKYMRPPEGEYSKRVLAIARDVGFRTVLWSFAYKDWDIKNQKGKEYAISEVTPYFHDGAILLLHAVSSDNADALAEIIDSARSKGYEFASLDNIK